MLVSRNQPKNSYDSVPTQIRPSSSRKMILYQVETSTFLLGEKIRSSFVFVLYISSAKSKHGKDRIPF